MWGPRKKLWLKKKESYGPACLDHDGVGWASLKLAMFLLPIETISLRSQVKQKLIRPKESQKQLLRCSPSVLVPGASRVTLGLYVQLDRHQYRPRKGLWEVQRYNPLSGMPRRMFLSGHIDRLATPSTKEMVENPDRWRRHLYPSCTLVSKSGLPWPIQASHAF